MRKATYRLSSDKCIVCIELFSFSVLFLNELLLHSPWASFPLCKLESDINGYPTGQMMLLMFLELFSKKKYEAGQHKHWIFLAKLEMPQSMLKFSLWL